MIQEPFKAIEQATRGACLYVKLFLFGSRRRSVARTRKCAAATVAVMTAALALAAGGRRARSYRLVVGAVVGNAEAFANRSSAIGSI